MWAIPQLCCVPIATPTREDMEKLYIDYSKDYSTLEEGLASNQP